MSTSGGGKSTGSAGNGAAGRARAARRNQDADTAAQRATVRARTAARAAADADDVDDDLEPAGGHRSRGWDVGGPGWAALVVSLLGTAASVYLTVEHFSANPSFACPENSAVNCVKVTTSEWSRMFGMPVAVLGLVYFVGMLVLCSPWLWRLRQLDWVRVAGAAGGVLTAVYLLWAELFKIEAICLWCTGVHVCALALLGLTCWRAVTR